MSTEDDTLFYGGMVEYALHIIHRTPTFKEFAVAMMDLAGYANPDIITIYEKLSNLKFPENVKFDVSFLRDHNRNQVLTLMQDWCDEVTATESVKKRRQKAKVKEDIDELHRKIKEFRDSEKFKDMLHLAAKFRYLAPFNAMLVYEQKPGAEFVLGVEQWEKLGRRPKVNGQKLVILMPFGPVQFVFDYSDTEPMPGTLFPQQEDMAELMDCWENNYDRKKGLRGRELWGRLKENLPRYGIAYHDDMNAAGGYCGYLREYTGESLNIRIGGGPNDVTEDFQAESRFLININRNHSPEMQFQTVCHELGHLFCRHQFYDRSKVRRLTLKEREFEAETVAWLVCRRQKIGNPSEEYLAAYAPDGELPDYSLNDIMKAVTEIENMIHGLVTVKRTEWYKNDAQYKAVADKAVKRYNEMKKAR